MKAKLIIISAISLMLAGCTKADTATSMSPDQTYSTYNQMVIDGISFEESKKFHSKAMTAKVEKQIVAMQKSNNDSLESILAFYTKAISEMAKCSELTLASEKIEDKTANLTYDRKDICNGGNVTKNGEQIRMVFENGWKIDENVSVYSD